MGTESDHKIRADFPVCFVLKESLFRECMHLSRVPYQNVYASVINTREKLKFQLQL